MAIPSEARAVSTVRRTSRSVNGSTVSLRLAASATKAFEIPATARSTVSIRSAAFPFVVNGQGAFSANDRTVSIAAVGLGEQRHEVLSCAGSALDVDDGQTPSSDRKRSSAREGAGSPVARRCEVKPQERAHRRVAHLVYLSNVVLELWRG